MTLHRSILFLHFVVLSCALSSPEKIKIIDTLSSDYYGSRSLIFLRNTVEFSDVWDTVKLASKAGLPSLVMDLPTFLARAGLNVYPKPIVVVMATRSTLLLYSQLSKKIKMSDFHWLFFTDVDEKNFSSYSVPYNCKFILISDSTGKVILSELFKYTEKSQLSHNALAFWEDKKEIALPNTGFYSRRMNFNGTELKYVTHKLDPCVDASFKTGDVVTCLNEQVWEMTMDILNATTKVILTNGRDPYSVVREFSSDPTTQASMSGYFVDSFIFSLVDYFWPLYRAELHVHLQYAGTGISWSRYLKPFSTSVWATSAGWVAGFSIAFFIARRLGMAYLHYEASGEDCRPEQWWTPLFALLSQGTSEPANSAWERLSLISAFIAPTVLIPAYGAAVLSFLAVQIPDMPFTHLSQMKDHPEYKLAGVAVYDVRRYLKDSSDETSQYLLHHGTLEDKDTPVDAKTAVERMCREPFAFIGTKITVMAACPECKFYRLPDTFGVIFHSMTMPKHSPYANTFNMIARNLRFTGVLQRLESHVAAKELHTMAEVNGDMGFADLPPVSFENILLLLLLLCLAGVASAVLLVIELVVARVLRRNLRITDCSPVVLGGP